MIFSVSPALKVTFCGTPEKSVLLAPPWRAVSMGMVMFRSGSADSFTLTVTQLPSSTVYVACS